MADEVTKITVELDGVHGQFDGRYEVDLAALKNRDTHTIKRLSGLRPLEYGDAFAQLDTDFIVALAAVGLQRAGVQVPDTVLWEAEIGTIRIIVPDAEPVEDDASPPDLTSSPAAPGSPASASESPESSGPISSVSSASLEPIPSRTGSLPSAASAVSVSATSAS